MSRHEFKKFDPNIIIENEAEYRRPHIRMKQINACNIQIIKKPINRKSAYLSNKRKEIKDTSTTPCYNMTSLRNVFNPQYETYLDPQQTKRHKSILLQNG